MRPSHLAPSANPLEGHQQGFFPGAGNLPLFYQRWLPSTAVQGILLLVHGLGGHSDWHHAIAAHFVPLHYGVYIFDLRGHGRSPGQRGHIDNWAEFRADLDCFVTFVQKEQPQQPLFALGHSLGGTILLDYVLYHPTVFQGIVLIAPAIGPVAIPPLKLALGRLLSYIWPRFSLPTGLDLACSTRDPDILMAYEQDPLRHRLGSARLSTEFQQAVRRIQAHAATFNLPVLLLHGTADCIVPVAGSRQFFDQVSSPHKHKQEYVDAYHDLYNDFNREQVLTDIETWLSKLTT